MNRARKTGGFSLIELMVVIVIAAMLMAVGVTWALPVLQQSRVTRQLVSIKGSFQQARARAIERNAPVEFTFSGGVLHALIDYDRDGDYRNGDDHLVIGESVTQGIDFGDTKVRQTNKDTVGPLNHWSGLAEVQAIPDFLDGKFIITPTGLVVGVTGHPVNGAYFLINEDDFRGALYISMLGDAKTAIKQNGSSQWVWND